MTGACGLEKSIFLEALDLETPVERARFLDRACAGQPQLRSSVEVLLRAHEEPHDLLDAAVSPVTECVGAKIGPYKLLEAIGEGGFGNVFMAQQQEPVRRKVALKVVKPGMETRQVIARFEAERQALAMMDHRNIAKIFDGGLAPSGRPFFVMELVPGVAITDFCEQNELDVNSRLELFINVCQAIQHAHQKGVIHRDLKPSNILVTLHDGTPVVKVIDFGIAKALGEQLTEKTVFTNFAQMMGTPMYMSPEQAAMSGLDVDTRTDIYSLGVLLYELLTGTTPFNKERLQTASFDDIRRIIREEEPETVTTRLARTRRTGAWGSGLGAGRNSIASLPIIRNPQPRTLRLSELDWIAMKALEKDRNRRYQSAGEMAADVQQYLRDEPVQACPPSVWYRFQKLARRNKAAITTATIVLGVLVIGTVVSGWQAIRAKQAEERAKFSLAAEKQARQEAEANLVKTRQVVDQYLTLTSESRLLDVPGLQPLRKELLEAALAYYEDFLKQRPSDPLLLADLAAGYLRVAHIYNAINASGKALIALEQGINIVEQLHNEFPDRTDWPLRLAGTYKVNPDLHFGSEDPAALGEALSLLERGIQIWQELATENATVAGFKSDLARLYSLRAEFEWACGRRDRALAGHHQARNLWESLARENPLVPEYRAELSCSLDGMGKIFDRLQRPQEAENAFRQCLELRQRLAADFPDRPDYRYEVALAELRLTRKLPAAKSADAAAKYREIKQLLAGLVAEFPGVPSFRENLAICHYDLACALWRMDRLDNAVAECRQSLAIFDRLSSDFPGLPQYRERVATRCADLALLLATADRNAEAERYYSEAVEAMEQLIAGSQQDAYRQRLCSIYQDQGDLMLALSRRKEATSAYRRAIELLQGVVARAPDVPLYVRELAAVLAKCPVVELRDTERAVELAERASHLAPEESASWYTLGLAQYRAGNFPAALAALKEWEEQSAGSDSREWFLLAITCWQLGNAPGATEEERARYQKEAHRSYARGVERQEQHKALNKDLFRLRAEAAALLSINESAPPPYLQPPPNL